MKKSVILLVGWLLAFLWIGSADTLKRLVFVLMPAVSP